MYVLSRDGGGLMLTHCTLAASTRRPSTLCTALAGNESCVRDAKTLVSAADRIVAPFGNDNAFADTPTPSSSTSPVWTTYSKTGPPSVEPTAASWRVPVPRFNVSSGVPVTTTPTVYDTPMRIRSCRVYVLPFVGNPRKRTKGRGTGVSLPFTLQLLSAGSSSWSSRAFVAPSDAARNDPPLNVNAPFGIRTPSVSTASRVTM